eukprot:CAMPEP_0184872980 /NCGR_PEP_ID=MMETSP0580-20130426/41587_1 /TAXON_ID=1118495 /ORGANISM="Dactyliosolen fragilissimus" /LENGTH=209 /DNA_ID=CAMNT_0027375839 /DNA_START=1948 /DNA_END=2578 /DNA_ORIENTATION=-
MTQYKKENDHDNITQLVNSIISQKDLEQKQLADLNEVLKLLVLNTVDYCFHSQLEIAMSNPFYYDNDSDTDSDNVGSCITLCPICTKKLILNIPPIKKKSVQDFLAQTFLLSPPSGIIYPSDLLTLMKKFPNVGIDVYGRKTSKAPDSKRLQMTLLQLIASGIIVFKISPKQNSNKNTRNNENENNINRQRAYACLGVRDKINPCYLMD